MKIKLEKYRSASDSQIDEVEVQLGIKLPRDYRSFLRHYDGATPEENFFEDDVNVSVDRFIPVAEVCRRSSKIEGLPDNALAIAEAPSGNVIYLTKDKGQVYFWDHETEGSDKKLASSFESFLKKLKPFDINLIQLKPGQVKSVWVDPDFKPEF